MAPSQQVSRKHVSALERLEVRLPILHAPTSLVAVLDTKSVSRENSQS